MNSYRQLLFVFAVTLTTVCGYNALSPCALLAAVNDVSGTYQSNRGDVTLDQAGFPPVVTVLLGNLAVWLADERVGERIEWDSENVQAGNVDGLECVLRSTYREGYVLEV